MTVTRYSKAAIFLHWAIALALAFQLGLGWRLEHIPKGPALFAAYQLHKSVGIAILLLTIARVAIRLIHRPPPLMADGPLALMLARGVHWLLYAVMLIGPLTGWILVSTARTKVPTLLFGVVPWPHLPVPHSWHEPAEGVHGAVAWLLLGLFFLHLGGALRHQFMKHENILGRMLPFLSPTPISMRKGVIATILAFFVMWLAHGAGWQVPFGETTAQPPAAPAPTQAAALAEPVAARPSEKVEDEAKKTETSEAAPLADWKVAPGGRLGFKASWANTPVDGSFKRWSAAIRFTPDAPEQTTIRATIDLASADTADSQRDESLKGGDFFDVGAHPKAVFTANGLRPLGGDRYQARGTLDLHGKSRPVALTLTLKVKDDLARVTGATTLDRTAFGVGTGEWAATDQIAASVGVSFNFTAKRLAS